MTGWLNDGAEGEDDGLALQSALYAYLGRVASGLGVGPEAISYELADQASAYLALTARLSGWPDDDVALVWDQRSGWALALESNPGAELRVLAYYQQAQLPAPEHVVAFVNRLFAGTESPATPPVPPRFDMTELADRLCPYAATADHTGHTTRSRFGVGAAVPGR